jgi:hypothetical protein
MSDQLRRTGLVYNADRPETVTASGSKAKAFAQPAPVDWTQDPLFEDEEPEQ